MKGTQARQVTQTFTAMHDHDVEKGETLFCLHQGAHWFRVVHHEQGRDLGMFRARELRGISRPLFIQEQSA